MSGSSLHKSNLSYLVVDKNEDIGHLVKLIIGESAAAKADYEPDALEALRKLSSEDTIYQGVFVDTDMDAPTTFFTN